MELRLSDRWSRKNLTALLNLCTRAGDFEAVEQVGRFMAEKARENAERMAMMRAKAIPKAEREAQEKEARQKSKEESL